MMFSGTSYLAVLVAAVDFFPLTVLQKYPRQKNAGGIFLPELGQILNLSPYLFIVFKKNSIYTPEITPFLDRLQERTYPFNSVLNG